MKLYLYFEYIANNANSLKSLLIVMLANVLNAVKKYIYELPIFLSKQLFDTSH
jgi:hypothetical protein